MFTASQIVAHLVGDYVFQNAYMAENKRRSFLVAISHGVCYTIPFIFITQNLIALFLIAFTHAIIDHFALARYVVYARNQFAPSEYRYKLKFTLPMGEGPNDRAPGHIAFFVFVVIDNTMHILTNGVILYYLT